MDWSTFTFRCSSYGALMTDPKEGNGLTETQAARLVELTEKENRTFKQGEELVKLIAKKNAKPELSATCKTELINIWVEQTYGRKRNISNKYIEKGLAVEEDSITLISRLKKKVYFKNDERIFNEFTNGEPDLYEGVSIRKADMILDTKSSWDIFTFFHSKTQPINKDYYWQMMGYMDLTGAKEARLVYCLINTPDTIMNDEKRKLLWKMGVLTEDSPLYQKACAELEKAMTFDDIPMEDRAFEQIVARDEDQIAAMHDRAIQCRQWLRQFEELQMNRVQLLTA
jgi:hypothetical protein